MKINISINQGLPRDYLDILEPRSPSTIAIELRGIHLPHSNWEKIQEGNRFLIKLTSPRDQIHAIEDKRTPRVGGRTRANLLHSRRRVSRKRFPDTYISHYLRGDRRLPGNQASAPAYECSVLPCCRRGVKRTREGARVSYGKRRRTFSLFFFLFFFLFYNTFSRDRTRARTRQEEQGVGRRWLDHILFYTLTGHDDVTT